MNVKQKCVDRPETRLVDSLLLKSTCRVANRLRHFLNMEGGGSHSISEGMRTEYDELPVALIGLLYVRLQDI